MNWVRVANDDDIPCHGDRTRLFLDGSGIEEEYCRPDFLSLFLVPVVYNMIILIFLNL